MSSRGILLGDEGGQVRLGVREENVLGADESGAALWLEAIAGTERAFAAVFDRHRALLEALRSHDVVASFDPEQNPIKVGKRHK